MILTEIKDNILYITISREEKLNALNDQILNQLESIFQDLKAYKSAYGVILMGAGEKSFVAGADLQEISQLTRDNAQKAAEKGQRIFQLIENSNKPVIAVINGFALGGGCELAMACHIRVATSNAKFAQPEVNYGIIPGYGGSQRLPKLIGKGRAMEMILTGITIDAQQALNWALVNYVLDSKSEALAKAENILGRIFEKSPVSISHAIKCVNDSQLNTVNGFESEAVLFGKCSESTDFKEGTMAFVEKRKAVFLR